MNQRKEREKQTAKEIERYATLIKKDMLIRRARGKGS